MPVILEWRLFTEPSRYKLLYEVSGYPKPELTFFMNGKQLTFGHFYQRNDEQPNQGGTLRGVIEINDHSLAVGNYTFVASNTLGNASSHVLTIKRLANIVIKYPKFDGNGYLQLRVPRNVESEFKFSLTFRPEFTEGLLLFSDQTTAPYTDFFVVVLKDGFVVFRFDCGSGEAELKSASRVNLNAWNQLVITRVNATGKLQLNNQQTVEGVSPGDYIRITLSSMLYVGGYSYMLFASRRLDTLYQFFGCIQELLINGRKVDFRERMRGSRGEIEYAVYVSECSANVCDHVTCVNNGTCTAISADESICLCPLGFYGDRCTESQPVHAPQFSGHSYIAFPSLQSSVASFTDIQIVFKPNSTDGLLLYEGFSLDWHVDFVSISLHNGTLEFRFDLGSGPAVLRSVQPLTVGSWHTVRASRTDRMGTLKIDEQAPVTGHSPGNYSHLNLFGGLYLGGLSNFDQTARHANVIESFSGCIQQVTINNRTLDLMGDASSGYNIRPCSSGG